MTEVFVIESTNSLIHLIPSCFGAMEDFRNRPVIKFDVAETVKDPDVYPSSPM